MNAGRLTVHIAIRDRQVAAAVEAGLAKLGCDVHRGGGGSPDLWFFDASGKAPAESGHRPWRIRVLLPGETLDPGTRQGFDDCVLFSPDPEALALQIEARLEVFRRLSEAEKAREALADAAARLEQQAERFRTLVESSADVFYVTDPNGRLTYASPNLFEASGYRPEELLGRSYIRLIAPEERRRVISYYLSMTASGAERMALDFRARRKDGSLVWVDQRTRVVRDKHGRVVEYRNVVRDISARKAMEEALKESEALFRTLTEAAPVAVTLLQGDRLVYANRFAREILALPNDAGLETIKYLDLVVPEQREQVRRWAADREAGRPAPPHYEIAVVTPGGQRRWFDLSVAVFHYRGKPARMAVAVDITEKKAVEQAFLHAQKMEAIGRLAGSVAHDFNNMLSVIVAHSELLKFKGAQDPTLLAAIEAILGAATRAAELTRKLLAFARKQEAQPEILDLNREVGDTLRVLRRLLGENVELSWHPAPDLLPVFADRSQLDQVVANLVVNARDAVGDRGHIWVTTANRQLTEEDCRRFPEGKPGRYVVLSVKDDGCGMDQTVLERIFEPFFTTKGEGKGTGLGLSTVFGIVRQHNGFIVVASEPGKGSTFEVYLPAAEGETTTVGEILAPLPTGSETILLVEDQPEVLEAAAFLLKQLGYCVLTASSPQQALEIARCHSGEIHLLLSDVGLPGMDGAQLATHVAELRPKIKVLLMSGYDQNVAALQGAHARWGPVLQKPLSAEAIACRIRQLLEEHSV